MSSCYSFSPWVPTRVLSFPRHSCFWSSQEPPPIFQISPLTLTAGKSAVEGGLGTAAYTRRQDLQEETQYWKHNSVCISVDSSEAVYVSLQTAFSPVKYKKTTLRIWMMGQIVSAAGNHHLNSFTSHFFLKNEVTHILYYPYYPIKLSTKCACKTCLTCFHEFSLKGESNR